MALGKRREFEVFTLSFLDCICCGFGAIILLPALAAWFVRPKAAAPAVVPAESPAPDTQTPA